MSSKASIEALPNEILHSIFEYLNFADLLLLGKVSKYFRRSVNQPNVIKSAVCLVGNNEIQGSRLVGSNRCPQKFKITPESVSHISKQLFYVSKLSTKGYSNICHDTAGILMTNLVNLTSMDLSGNDDVTDETVRSIAINLTKLTDLNLSNCAALTQKSVFFISKCCHSLRSLNIANTRCATNKSWLVLCATHSENLLSLNVSNNFLVNFNIFSTYPKSVKQLDISRNPSVTFEYLNAIVKERLGMIKMPLLKINICDCEAITGDEAALLNSYPAANLEFLSNPKLQNYTAIGLREYINRLIAY